MTTRTTAGVTRAALVFLAAGALALLWQVGARVMQLAWLSFKYGQLESITAGRTPFLLFIGLSVAGAAGAVLVARRTSGSSWRRVGWVVASSYLAAAALWSGLIMSPLVEFTRW